MSEDEKTIEIKIVIHPRKLDELIALMPDHAKGKGERTKVIYYFIDLGMGKAIAAANPPQHRQHISNREYLRNIGRK